MTHITHEMSLPEDDADAEAEAVSNSYHDRKPERSSPLGERLAQALCGGKLTEAMVKEARITRRGSGLSDVDSFSDRYAARDVVVTSASWALITVEYADRLADVMRGKQVLEVGAGRGVLAAMMRARGIAWTATDRCPPTPKQPWHPEPPVTMGAMEAVRTLPFDALVWSWWPYCDSADYDMAQIVGDRPIWIIGEGGGGCTGSGQFHECRTGWDTSAGREPKPEWGDDYDPAVDKMLPLSWHTVCAGRALGIDVPEWDGIHDHTYVALPIGRKLADFFPTLTESEED
jgi:hypothetical protein